MALGLSVGIQEICPGLIGMTQGLRDTCIFLQQLNMVLEAGTALKQGRGSEKISAKPNSVGFFSFVLIMQREWMSTAGSNECLLYQMGQPSALQSTWDCDEVGLGELEVPQGSSCPSSSGLLGEL